MHCGWTVNYDKLLNGVPGFESACTFCQTDNDSRVWSKRRSDQLIEQGVSKDRWEIIHGVHVVPVNRGIWNLYRDKTDDLYFEKFIGSKAELRACCKELNRFLKQPDESK